MRGAAEWDVRIRALGPSTSFPLLRSRPVGREAVLLVRRGWIVRLRLGDQVAAASSSRRAKCRREPNTPVPHKPCHIVAWDSLQGGAQARSGYGRRLRSARSAHLALLEPRRYALDYRGQ